MRRITFLGLFLLWLALPYPARAIVDPRQSPNNRFGIHILEAEDLIPAARLVNSNGGQWGYVTLVIRQNDLNQGKWQQIFDELRRLKLIPLLRLATAPENSHWLKPTSEDVDRMVEFLNSLNWVVQNRYVILFNEPNHAKEWGNEIKPDEYAAIVREFSLKLKAASEDFFILPAGFDTAAPKSLDTMEATEYWRQMYLSDREVFSYFDGWNSHSYPNPDFSGPVTGSGFGSLRSYQEEVSYLNRFGLPGNLPLFITETGWRNQGRDLSQNYQIAYTQVWTQPNLVAVTPFVLNYPQAPFSQFSWKNLDGSFLAHYQAVAALEKTSGQPQQINASRLIDQNLPDEVVAASDYRFFVELLNTGQSIWERQDFSLGVETNLAADSLLVSHIGTTEPGQPVKVDINLKTGSSLDPISLKIQLTNKGQPFGQALEITIQVIPPPTIVISARRLIKVPDSDDNYRLLIYDADNRLLSEIIVSLSSGRSGKVSLYNLVPNQAYRLVLLEPYYLRRQTWIVLRKGANLAKFKPL
ncbi:MAG: hypothetical protein U1C50_01025, partial [Patescibacteria group bacterium]|nr:hypothetical protein [Patescibacteria group bacterium]